MISRISRTNGSVTTTINSNLVFIISTIVCNSIVFLNGEGKRIKDEEITVIIFQGNLRVNSQIQNLIRDDALKGISQLIWTSIYNQFKGK